jgi:hypothetical protein
MSQESLNARSLQLQRRVALDPPARLGYHPSLPPLPAFVPIIFGNNAVMSSSNAAPKREQDSSSGMTSPDLINPSPDPGEETGGGMNYLKEYLAEGDSVDPPIDRSKSQVTLL